MSNRTNEPNRIRITRFVEGGYGDKIVDTPVEIEKIAELTQREAEKCPYFDDNPALPMFRIELYSGAELIERIGVTGDFVCRNDEWYLMPDSSLAEELRKCTEDVQFAQMPPCAFVKH
jgi:hypothetical protein